MGKILFTKTQKPGINKAFPQPVTSMDWYKILKGMNLIFDGIQLGVILAILI